MMSEEFSHKPAHAPTPFRLGKHPPSPEKHGRPTRGCGWSRQARVPTKNAHRRVEFLQARYGPPPRAPANGFTGTARLEAPA